MLIDEISKFPNKSQIWIVFRDTPVGVNVQVFETHSAMVEFVKININTPMKVVVAQSMNVSVNVTVDTTPTVRGPSTI